MLWATIELSKSQAAPEAVHGNSLPQKPRPARRAIRCRPRLATPLSVTDDEQYRPMPRATHQGQRRPQHAECRAAWSPENSRRRSPQGILQGVVEASEKARRHREVKGIGGVLQRVSGHRRGPAWHLHEKVARLAVMRWHPAHGGVTHQTGRVVNELPGRGRHSKSSSVGQRANRADRRQGEYDTDPEQQGRNR